MKKSRLFFCIVALCMLASFTVAAAGGRDAQIKSHGTLKERSATSEEVYFESEDLRSLASQLDLLENSYKSTAKDSLSIIGSTSSTDAWADICSAIEHSQDCDTPASADNLSLGKQAWVNGVLITGNGKDEEEAYNKGAASIGANDVTPGTTYTFTQDVPSCFILETSCFHGSDGVDGNSVGSDPTVTVPSSISIKSLFCKRYARNGFNTRVRVYHVTGARTGDTITLSYNGDARIYF